jgi:thioredoxin reductase (NADPH)
MPEQAERVAAGHEPNSRVRRPAILAVDDEPAVLAAVARDLRRGFGERFRVLRAASGSEALEVLRELRARGEEVAMLIADQRMPGMPGTEYLM